MGVSEVPRDVSKGAFEHGTKPEMQKLLDVGEMNQRENIWSRCASVIPLPTKTEGYAKCFRVCLSVCQSLI